MTARCKKCNHCEFFDRNDEFGIRLRLKDQVCECGGKFQKMYPTHNPIRYINSKADSYLLTELGEFKLLRPVTI